MKKIIIIISSLVILVSCQDILEERPKTPAVEIFYNTAGEVESAVFAVYAVLQRSNAMGSLYPIQLEVYSDLFVGRGSYAPLNDHALDNTNINRTGFMWDDFYAAIRNANIVISRAPKGTQISEADINKLVGEARFLRAFTYFHLVRNWGGVPLRTELNMTEIAIKRASEADVYQLIEQDLIFAEQNLPDKPAQAGRATKWSAKAVLADVYLTLNRPAEARDRADEIINSANFSLVPVTVGDDFLKLYGADVVTTPEEIFSLKFIRANERGWTFVTFAHHPGANPRYLGAGQGFWAIYTNTAHPTINAWPNADLRKTYNLYPYDFGLGANTLLNRKFRDPLATTPNLPSNDYPLYRYADVLLMYAEAASRAANGPTALAMERLNMVHRRAYGLPATSVSTVDYNLATYSTAQGFLNLVVNERGYETMYEAKRWHELKRLGLAKQYILVTEGKVVPDKFMLWPIPLSELNFNPALNPTTDQNPGF
jgi:starch-binding outer membrane protein, SusD/RagB family